MTGMLAEQWSFPEFAPMEVIPATVRLTIYDSGQIRVDAHAFQQFIRDVETGAIKLPISRTFRLAEIADAHRFMEGNTSAGKIVVLTRPKHYGYYCPRAGSIIAAPVRGSSFLYKPPGSTVINTSA